MGIFGLFGEPYKSKRKKKPKPPKENGYILIFLKSREILHFGAKPLDETKKNYEEFLNAWEKSKYLKRERVTVKCEDISAIGYYKGEGYSQ